MKKKVIRPIVMICMFIVSVIAFGITTNQTNEDLTAMMEEPTLPTLSFYYQEIKLNELHGYVSEMDMTKMRDSILPIRDDRKVKLHVNTYGAAVDYISYEIRSIDGERLIADAILTDYSRSENTVTSEFEVQNLLESEQEYLMLIKVCSGDRQIFYYTRIMQTMDCYVDECLAFALEFHEYTFRDDADTFIPTYMDPATGDATTLNYVDLSCTLRQITWADFKGTVLGNVSVSFKEINDSYNVLVLDYVLSYINELGETEYYNIEEYYRLRETQTRMYVLNFERTMNRIFSGENTFLTENNLIQLGIRSQDVEYHINEAGDVIAFVQEGDLWCYNVSTNELAQVFSFRSAEGIDERENWKSHDIQIVRLDEAGSVDFIVYGYMNRGEHEGEVGIGVFHYDGLSHTVEEELFLPVKESYEVLRAELGQLLYENDLNLLYMMMHGDVYCIQLDTLEVKKVVSDLRDGCFAISNSGQYLAWVDEKKRYTSNVIWLMNMADGSIYEINEGQSYYLRPLQFIEDDFIYGMANKNDVTADATGNIGFPMCALKIVDTVEDSHKILKTYAPDGYYIDDIYIEQGTIIVNLVERLDGQYIPAEADSIMNRDADSKVGVSIATTVTDVKQTQVQLVLKRAPGSEKTKRITSRMLLLEEDRILHLDAEVEEQRYYVYVKGEVRLTTDSISEAILLANEQLGIVVNEKQQYVWMRAHKTTQPAFHGITPYETDKDANAIVQCVSAMLVRENQDVSVKDRMALGKTPKKILEETLEDVMVLDLSGCTVEEMLYYVSKGSPVFALTSADSAVLIVGYSTNSLFYYDPLQGRKESMSIEAAGEWFESAGNVFVSYLRK